VGAWTEFTFGILFSRRKHCEQTVHKRNLSQKEMKGIGIIQKQTEKFLEKRVLIKK